MRVLQLFLILVKLLWLYNVVHKGNFSIYSNISFILLYICMLQK